MTSVHVAAVALLIGGACSNGNDDDGDGANPDDTRSTTTEQPTTTTQPQASGDGQQEAFALVEALVLEATELTDQLLQDPSLAADEASPDLVRLRELYTEDSPTPPDVLARLEDLRANGQMVRPGPSGIFREFFVHGLAAVDERTVRFNFCANQDQETVDTNGTVVDRFSEVSQGAGEARYVNGSWRFYGLHRDEGSSFATEPGSAVPGFCQSLYDDEDQA